MMSNTHKFGVERSAPPANQRKYVGGLTYEAAIEYGTAWAADDVAPVTISLDEGSGRVQRDLLVIEPDGRHVRV